VKALIILSWSKESRLELIAETEEEHEQLILLWLEDKASISVSCEEWRELVVQKKGV